MNADVIVLVCSVIVILGFLVKAVHVRVTRSDLIRDNPYDEQMLASKSVKTGKIAMSTAATYSAFATVLFWFVTLGGNYSWTLFLIPVCLFCGNYLCIFTVRHLSIPLGVRPSIGKFLRDNSNCKTLHYVIDWIVVVFAFSAVLVELVIGSGILASMVPNLPHAQLAIFIFLTLVVCSYVVIGNMRAVIETDAIQFWLALASTLALIIYAFVFVSPAQETTIFLYPPRLTLFEFIAFILSVFSVQFLGPICKLHNWHRLATAENQQAALRGLNYGSMLAAILWALMIIAALKLNAMNVEQVTFVGIFGDMKSYGGLAAYLFYPVVFVGLIAAMISTADSAMIALFNFFYESIHRVKPEVEPTLRHNFGLGVCLFLVLLVAYWVNQTDLQGFAITVIYFLFNQLLVAFPTLLFLAVESKLLTTREDESRTEGTRQSSHRILAFGAALGWVTVLAMSAIGYLSGKLMWTMFASISGVAVSFLVSCFALPGLSRPSDQGKIDR